MSSRKCLVLLSNSGVTRHSFSTGYMARALEKLGYEIHFAQCNGGGFHHCGVRRCLPSMKTDEMCRMCISYSEQFSDGRRKFEYSGERVKLGIEILIQSSDFIDFSVKKHGVNLSRVAAYNLILREKIQNTDELLEKHRYLYAETILELERFLDQMEGVLRVGYDLILAYNTNYGIERGLHLMAESIGVPCLSIHGGPSYRYVHDSVWAALGNLTMNAIEHKNYYQDRILDYTPPTLDGELVKKHIAAHFLKQSHLTFSYDMNQDGMDELRNWADGKSIALLAGTSEDEYFATHFALFPERDIHLAGPFENQKDWIDFTVRRFLEDGDKSSALVIRPHPRSFEVGGQEMLDFASRMSKEYPDRIRINLPEDRLPIHQVLSVTDLVLQTVSTVAVDSAYYGIPAISISGSMFDYPIESLAICTPFSKEEYWEKVKQMILLPRTEFRLLRAVQWLNAYLAGNSFMLSGEGYFAHPDYHSEDAVRIRQERQNRQEPSQRFDEFLKYNSIEDENLNKIEQILNGVPLYRQFLAGSDCIEGSQASTADAWKGFIRQLYIQQFGVWDNDRNLIFLSKSTEEPINKEGYTSL